MAEPKIPDCEGHVADGGDLDPAAQACRLWVTLCTGRNDHHPDNYSQDADIESILINVLTDLRHLCDVEGLQFHELDRQAQKHWISETKGRDLEFRKGFGSPKTKARGKR